MLEPWRRFLNLLQEAGDVVLAAGGPGEGVGVGCDVRRHQLGRLVPLRPAGVPDPVMVHSEAVRRGTQKGEESETSPSPANQTLPLKAGTSSGSSARPRGVRTVTRDDSETAGCVGQWGQRSRAV